MAATNTSSDRWLWWSFDKTITGLRFIEVRSLNGIGISTISRCLGVIPDLVVDGVVPEGEGGFSRFEEIGFAFFVL